MPTKYANAGQVCVTPDRFYVHEIALQPFCEGFAARAKALKLGHGLDEATQMGPLINARRRDAIEAMVADARAKGGRIVAGGSRPADRNAGFFFEPTVITDLPDDAKALAEENFGPIAAITPFAIGRGRLRARQRQPLRPFGLRVHARRPAARGRLSPASSPAWSASTPSRSLRPRRLSAASNTAAWAARAAPRASATIPTSSSPRWCCHDPEPDQALWAENKAAINGWCSVGNGFTAEIMASAGYDFVTADLQHGAFDYHAALGMFQAMRASGVAVMARVPWLDPARS